MITDNKLISELTVKEFKQLISNPNSVDEEKFVGARAVSDMLKCTPQHVYNQARAGILPYYKIGKKTLFKRSEIEEFLENQREKRSKYILN